eukprot:scaffold51757_cov42-Cyclotella_meneghiniana.AAC.19
MTATIIARNRLEKTQNAALGNLPLGAEGADEAECEAKGLVVEFMRAGIAIADVVGIAVGETQSRLLLLIHHQGFHFLFRFIGRSLTFRGHVVVAVVAAAVHV